MVGRVPSENSFLFFFFVFRGSRIRVDSFFNESSLFVDASRPRILVSLVETSTTTSGAFKRELAVADHARMTSKSFSIISLSFNYVLSLERLKSRV